MRLQRPRFKSCQDVVPHLPHFLSSLYRQLSNKGIKSPRKILKKKDEFCLTWWGKNNKVGSGTDLQVCVTLWMRIIRYNICAQCYSKIVKTKTQTSPHSPHTSADFRSVTLIFSLPQCREESEKEPLWKIKSAVLLMAMTHHSDIIKPSASAEPIRACLGSDSSITEEEMMFEEWLSKGKSRTMATSFSWESLKAFLAVWRVCWWISVVWLYDIFNSLLDAAPANPKTPTLTASGLLRESASKHESLLSKSSSVSSYECITLLWGKRVCTCAFVHLNEGTCVCMCIN